MQKFKAKNLQSLLVFFIVRHRLLLRDDAWNVYPHLSNELISHKHVVYSIDKNMHWNEHILQAD
jgi:hypothetical protein